MKLSIILLLMTLASFFVQAQAGQRDSLLAIIDKNNKDTNEVKALLKLSQFQVNIDSAVNYAEKASALAEEIGFIKGKADCDVILSYLYMNSSPPDFAKSIQYGLNALDAYKQINDKAGIVEAYGGLQAGFREIGDYKSALAYALPAARIAESDQVRGVHIFPGHRQMPLFYAEIAQTYLLMDQLDSALFYTQKSIGQKELFNDAEWNFPVYLLATIQTKRGDYIDALANFRKAYPLAIKNNFPHDTLQIFAGISTLFRKMEQYDSTILYAHTVISAWTSESEYKNLSEAIDNLALVYKLKGNADSSLKYVELGQSIKDSIFANEKDREIKRIEFTENLKQQQLIADQLKYKNRVQLYSFIGGATILLLIALVLLRNYQQQKKARSEIQAAYSKLKTTQQQLIQSEKMASLGELTAGIAHEIQNPLNFVNNFSDVNAELIDELNREAEEGNFEEVKAIAKDIKENEQKINHHGRRADAIVKGMLQHSRTGSRQKEPTDINALCEEYLRLSYHGMRAKDKSFNAVTKTEFDNSIDKINVVPQDIGRVILNLINNAFYAVNEKQKQGPRPLKGGKEVYEPIVTVTTRRLGSPLGDGGKVEISVKDNGNGIRQNILDKIFQPFFTTKPTGQGTGLGLSLAYDIITKGHGGELKIETKEGEGSEFKIILFQTN